MFIKLIALVNKVLSMIKIKKRVLQKVKKSRKNKLNLLIPNLCRNYNNLIRFQRNTILALLKFMLLDNLKPRIMHKLRILKR